MEVSKTLILILPTNFLVQNKNCPSWVGILILDMLNLLYDVPKILSHQRFDSYYVLCNFTFTLFLYCSVFILDAKVLASSLIEKIATDIVGKNSLDLSTKERESLSKRTGIAIKAIFPHDTKVHNTRLLGIRHHQKRYYVGLSIV